MKKEKYLKNSIIIDDMRYCLVCGSPYPEVHHVLFGPNRKNSDKYGLIIPLCAEHHRGNNGPHMNRKIDLKYKEMAQRKFEEKHGTRKEFIELFGMGYL